MAHPRRARSRCLELFSQLAEHYGIAIDVDEARTPKGLRMVLERLRGHAAEKALSFALLRSLKQATYDVNNVGHFGLASRDYLHFTSPIRRYPDLIDHRLLKIRLATLGKPSGGWKSGREKAPPEKAELQRMAAEASFSERTAMEAEREVVDIYRAYFMRDRVGDVFEGTISGVMGFGIFVVVDDPFIEGLVRVEALSDDYYLFDEITARLVGRRTGRTFALGDTVRIEVQSVSVVRRKNRLCAARASRARTAARGRRRSRAGGQGRGPAPGPAARAGHRQASAGRGARRAGARRRPCPRRQAARGRRQAPGAQGPSPALTRPRRRGRRPSSRDGARRSYRTFIGSKSAGNGRNLH